MRYDESFLHYLQYEKRFSAHTIEAYRSDLRQFIDFHDSGTGKTFDPVAIDHKIIRKWIVYLMENKVSARSVNRKITTLKSFYNFLLREGHVKINPLDRVLSPKTKKKLPEFVVER